MDISDESTWPEIMTIPEVAQALRLSERTVYRMIVLGNLPASRLGHSRGSWRVRKKDVLKVLESEEKSHGH